MSTGLLPLLERAAEARRALAGRLLAEGTDCWRLFHGAAEGREGLALDRYGDLVLVQTFREPLAPGELAEIEGFVRGRDPALAHVVWNHRGVRGPGFAGADAPEAALAERLVHERGLAFLFRARHRGLDPWLFLDLRAGRRRVAELAPGRSVLNLFAYTCSVGVAAASAGTSEVWNVDFSAGNLDVGLRNLQANRIDAASVRMVHEDALPVMRQLAGLAVKGRGAARSFLPFEPRSFDLVFLDPPAWSKGPFGAVDVARDYASLFKPALLATAEGGTILATHHLPAVSRAQFAAQLAACAEKAGRPLASIEVHGPEEDFPAREGDAPLKWAVCRLRGGT